MEIFQMIMDHISDVDYRFNINCYYLNFFGQGMIK